MLAVAPVTHDQSDGGGGAWSGVARRRDSEAEGLHYFQVNLRQIAEIAGNLVERIIRHRASKIAGSEF